MYSSTFEEEWMGVSGVTSQLKSGWKSKEGRKSPSPKKNYIDQKIIAEKKEKKEIPCWISDPLVKFSSKEQMI